jgi:outer membrane biosynthesis protein TonB
MVVFGCWILLLLWDLPIFSYQSPEPEPRPEPEVTVVLRPLVKMPPKIIPKPEVRPELKPKKPLKPKPPVAKKTPEPPKVAQKKKETRKAPKEPKRKYTRTSKEQAGTPDQDTDLIGDRDTRAASDMAPTLGADPNKPTQAGDNPLYQGQVETVTRKYQDGSVGMDSRGEETERPQEATASMNKTPGVDEVPQVTPEPPKPLKKDTSQPKNKHLKVGDHLPTPNAVKEKVLEKPKEKILPKAQLNQSEQKNTKGKKVDQSPKKDGFSGHSRKNKITGSISRRGKSSLNVKNSPLGRYQAQVSKAVELQWRRNCEQHRDYIVPGVISLRFYVDAKGKVSGIKFQEVIEGNYIEQGFTQRAIRQAKLPRMSKSVIKELKGEPLELIYNFYF